MSEDNKNAWPGVDGCGSIQGSQVVTTTGNSGGGAGGEDVRRLQSERDALAAKLAALTDEIMAIMNDSRGVDGYHLNGVVATWDSFNLLDIILSPPQQHLRDVRADAGRAGFIAGTKLLMGDRETNADEYAERIRSGSQS